MLSTDNWNELLVDLVPEKAVVKLPGHHILLIGSQAGELKSIVTGHVTKHQLVIAC